MTRIARTLAVAVAAALCLAPVQAFAEGFIDIYSGGAFTSEEDFRGDSSSPPLSFKVKSVDFDGSFLIGARAGFWLEPLPWAGVAVDVFFFQPDVARQQSTIISSGTGAVGDFANITSTTGSTLVNGIDIKVLAVSADAMVRFPVFVSPEFRRGQLQPYAFVGPGLFISQAEQDNQDLAIGLKTGAGFKWLVSGQVGFFGEYRYTHFSPDLDFGSAGDDLKFEGDINTQYLIVGVSFSF